MNDASTDLSRWADAESLSRGWDERCRFAARFVRPGLRIIDIGCGAMAVERLFAPVAYLPVDVVARDDRTRVIDLNERPLPPEWLDGVELATLLGVIEYLRDPAGLLATLADRGVALLASYNCVDLAPAGEHRDRDGWLNAFDVAGIEALASAAGYEPLFRYVFGERQAVWLWLPRGRDPAAVSPVGQASRGGAVPARPTLVVAGFLGRGNCGDEAIFQVIHDTFAPTHDIVAAVDEHGAHRGFWDWYPYDRCRIVHQGNLAMFHELRRVAGLLVGGGGLPSGFGGGLVDAARAADVPTAFAGVDVPLTVPNGRPVRLPAVHGYLARFDHVAARTAAAVAELSRTGLRVHHGADWALALETDQAADLVPTPSRVAVVLREWPLEWIDWRYVEAIGGLLDGLRARGLEPCWAPFCPEDERFLGELALRGSAPVERCWWNPRRMKQVVATSAAVVSVGRLHPLVFAAATATPALSLAVPGRAAESRPSVQLAKLREMTAELGIPSAATVAEALACFDEGFPPPAAAPLVAAARDRLAAMTAALATLFRG